MTNQSVEEMFMIIADILNETVNKSDERIILDEMQMIVDEKLISAIEIVNYDNKYTVVEKIKEIISELEYYVKHKELINCEHVAFYNPSAKIYKRIYNKYLRKIFSVANNIFERMIGSLFKQNSQSLLLLDVPTLIHGFKEKKGLYIDSITGNNCKLDDKKYTNLLEISDSKKIDLNNLLRDISVFSGEMNTNLVISVIPKSENRENIPLFSSIDELWIQGKDVDISVFSVMKNLSCVNVYNRISAKNKELIEEYGKKNDIEIRFIGDVKQEFDNLIIMKEHQDTNNVCYFYLLENLLVEISWFLAKNKAQLKEPLEIINSELVFNSEDDEIKKYIKDLQVNCNKDIQNNNNIYASYKLIVDELLEKMVLIQKCLEIKEGLGCINQHIKIEKYLFDLIVKLNQVYKEYPESNCKQKVRDYCKLFSIVSGNVSIAQYLEYDYFEDENNLKNIVDQTIIDVLDLKYDSQFYYHNIIKHRDILGLSVEQLYLLITKVDELDGVELFILAEYYYSTDCIAAAKKNYLESLYKGYSLSGDMLYANFELSDDEIKKLADCGIARAAEKVGQELYKKLKNKEIDFYNEEWKDCLKYLHIAAARKLKKTLKTLGEIYYDCAWKINVQDDYEIVNLYAEKSLYYYKLSDSNNSTDKKMFDRVAELLYGLERYSECVEWAEEKNSSSCNYIVGRIFENGEGYAVDETKALLYYEKAIEQGHPEAQVAYEKLNALIEERKKKNIVSENTSYSSYTYYSSYYGGYYSGYSSSGCFVKGTKILLDNNETKNVENIVCGDKVVIYDHFNGEISISNVIGNVHDSIARKECPVINLKFDNDRVLEIAISHVLFDFSMKQYVMINDKNFNEFIGHQFICIENNKINYTKLIECSVQTQEVDYYVPLSEMHLNVVAEGLLTMPPTELTLGIFDVDENMVYDTSILDEIGITPYERIKDYVTEEEYSVLPCRYIEAMVKRSHSSMEAFSKVIDLFREQKKYNDGLYAESEKIKWQI